MKQIALIKCSKHDGHIFLDISGELGDILTTIGIALYQIEISIPEEQRAEYRTDVLKAINAPRAKYKGGKIDENC